MGKYIEPLRECEYKNMLPVERMRWNQYARLGYVNSKIDLFHKTFCGMIRRLNQKNRATAALAVTSTAVAVIALALSVISIRRNPTITKSEV